MAVKKEKKKKKEEEEEEEEEGGKICFNKTLLRPSTVMSRARISMT
jgi:hypothetical protein